MQVQGLGAFFLSAPVAASRKEAPATAGDRVELGGSNPTEVLRNPKASPEQLRRAMGKVVLDCSGGAIPSPTLQAALQLLQRLNQDPGADAALKDSLADHLSRCGLGVNGSITPGKIPEAEGPVQVIGGSVYPVPPAYAPGIDLVGLYNQVEANNQPEDPKKPLSAPSDRFWGQLHQAGAAELTALSELLEQRERLHPDLDGQAGELHRRILVANPDRATETYYQKHLKPALHSTSAIKDMTCTVAHFYGPDRVLSEILPQAEDKKNWFIATQSLEQIELYQRAGFHPFQENLDRLVELAQKDIGSFDNHNDPIVRVMACLGHEAERIPLEKRLALQNGLLDHPSSGWAQTLCKKPAVTVLAGAPELVANLWQNQHNQTAQALLVQLPQDEMSWARLGLLVQTSDSRIKSAYQVANLARKLGNLEPLEAIRQESQVAALAGVTDDKEVRKQLVGRLMKDQPPGEYPRLEKMADDPWKCTLLLPVLERAFQENTVARSLSELEGLMARQGKGILGGHEHTVVALYQDRGQRSVEDLERRFNRVGEIAPSTLGSTAGGPQRLSLLRLTRDIPTDELVAADNPVLASLQRLLQEDKQPDQALENLESLRSACGHQKTFNQMLAGLKKADDVVLKLSAMLENLEGAEKDRALTILQSPLEPQDAMTLVPLSEQLFRERGGESFAQGMQLLERLKVVVPEERGKAAETGLQSLLAGESLEKALEKVLRTMIVGGTPSPSVGIEQTGSHVQIGGARLMVRQRKANV